MPCAPTRRAWIDALTLDADHPLPGGTVRYAAPFGS